MNCVHVWNVRGQCFSPTSYEIPIATRNVFAPGIQFHSIKLSFITSIIMPLVILNVHLLDFITTGKWLVWG